MGAVDRGYTLSVPSYHHLLAISHVPSNLSHLREAQRAAAQTRHHATRRLGKDGCRCVVATGQRSVRRSRLDADPRARIQRPRSDVPPGRAQGPQRGSLWQDRGDGHAAFSEETDAPTAARTHTAASRQQRLARAVRRVAGRRPDAADAYATHTLHQRHHRRRHFLPRNLRPARSRHRRRLRRRRAAARGGGGAETVPAAGLPRRGCGGRVQGDWARRQPRRCCPVASEACGRAPAPLQRQARADASAACLLPRRGVRREVPGDRPRRAPVQLRHPLRDQQGAALRVAAPARARLRPARRGARRGADARAAPLRLPAAAPPRGEGGRLPAESRTRGRGRQRAGQWERRQRRRGRQV
mmetsp:Transcript_19842/g.62255  ORF Transcript_19842/g.62255 Transcript_19842/m.62255 type:complete len:356 (+) Transcript_19842:176-1243(+)